MPKIERMFAFVSEDTGPDDEGIIGVCEPLTGIFMPMVGADQARIESLLPKAQEVAEVTGKQFRILEFSVRKDVTDQYLT